MASKVPRVKTLPCSLTLWTKRDLGRQGTEASDADKHFRRRRMASRRQRPYGSGPGICAPACLGAGGALGVGSFARSTRLVSSVLGWAHESETDHEADGLSQVVTAWGAAAAERRRADAAGEVE